MFSWGATYSSKDTSWKSEDTQDIENAKKEFAAKSTADKLLAKAGAYRGVNTTTEPKMLGSFGASVNPFVSVQGVYNSNEHKLTMDGDAGATLAFKAAFTQTFMMGPVPFFAGVDFSMGATIAADVTLKMDMGISGGTLDHLKSNTSTAKIADSPFPSDWSWAARSVWACRMWRASRCAATATSTPSWTSPSRVSAQTRSTAWA